MDKSARFTLKEVHACMTEEGKTIKYKTLYSRFRSLMRKGTIPEGTNSDALTYDDVKALMGFHSRATRPGCRKEAVQALRRNLRTDGFL